MAKTSAGLLLWRTNPAHGLQVLVVHPGGPFWASKDDGAWSIPKGEFEPGAEEPLAAAKREFEEELGTAPPTKGYVAIGETKLKSGKVIHAWAVEGDLDADSIVSGMFEMEWPPRSGRRQAFPEVDRAAWLSLEAAAKKLNPAQQVFLDRLGEL